MPLAARIPPQFPELAAEIARQGITHAQLSHAANCHSGYISQIIKGHGTPSEALKERIALALGRPVDELFAEADS